MFKFNISLLSVLKWLTTRVAVIYLVIFIFCLICVDLKSLDMRIKTRHLNDAIPDFSSLIIFAKGNIDKNDVDWMPYKKYFGLVVSYMPDDVITKQLLGYVDYYRGDEKKAIALFKSAAIFNGQKLFWANYNLGVLYYKKGMWSQSSEYLLNAISSNPKLTMVLIGNSLVYKQIFASPYFKYTLSDEFFDAQSKAYILLLSSFYHLKQFDKMILIANYCLTNQDLSYKDAFYYYSGLAFLEEGQVEKAFLLFQKSLSIKKNNPDVYYAMANIYQHVGQLDQARNFIQISYALHQKNDSPFPYEAHVNLQFF